MSMNLIDHSVNIIALKKNGRNYGMCCAWAMQVSEDKMLCTVGPQSTTGKIIAINDIIGFSNLQKNQADIALKLGHGHSADTDKLSGIDYREDEGAILIKNSHAEIKCQVIDMLHLKHIESEILIYLQILDTKENDEKSLLMSDFD